MATKNKLIKKPTVSTLQERRDATAVRNTPIYSPTKTELDYWTADANKNAAIADVPIAIAKGVMRFVPETATIMDVYDLVLSGIVNYMKTSRGIPDPTNQTRVVDELSNAIGKKFKLNPLALKGLGHFLGNAFTGLSSFFFAPLDKALDILLTGEEVWNATKNYDNAMTLYYQYAKPAWEKGEKGKIMNYGSYKEIQNRNR